MAPRSELRLFMVGWDSEVTRALKVCVERWREREREREREKRERERERGGGGGRIILKSSARQKSKKWTN